jgi:hypothetical protein
MRGCERVAVHNRARLLAKRSGELIAQFDIVRAQLGEVFASRRAAGEATLE